MKKGTPQPRGFHFMLYGPPGGGKTTLASQMPKPVAILDLDKGSGWLYAGLDGVDVYTLGPEEDPAKEIRAFLTAATKGQGNAGQYRSIAIDTISSMRGQHLAHLAGNSLFYEIGDYGVVTNWLKQVLFMTQFASQMIMWISHMKEVQDGPRLVIRPAGLSDNGLQACVEMLDSIIYMGKTVGKGGDTTRFLTTEEMDPQGGRVGILAKDRTGFLPDTMELPELNDDGTPPAMFKPFFEEIIKELGYNRALPKKKAKKKPAKKKPAAKKK